MLKHQDLYMCGLKLTNMSNCRPLEIVGHGREIQLQLGEKCGKIV